MLNVNINYPYPIIRDYLEDYNSTIFEGKLTVSLEKDGYYVKPKFEINNDEINKLIETGFLSYAIEVQCVSTWFRKFYKIQNNETIRLDPHMIHERVELMPCVIVTKSIESYKINDFVDEYQDINIKLKSGDVVAIGTKRVFDALYQNDIIKDGTSIVNVKGSDSIKEIEYDYSKSIIVITLPMKQYEDYIDCGYNKSKYKVLNAILTIPVLVEVITIIRDDELYPEKQSGLSGNAWYKTIVANLKRYAENNENKYMQLLNSSFLSAEILLGNNYVDALNYVQESIFE